MSNIVLRAKQKIEEVGLNHFTDEVTNLYSIGQVGEKLLGYSKNINSQSKKELKEFLLSLNINLSHFTVNGLKPSEHITKLCPVCNKEFTLVKSTKTLKQVTCSVGCANTLFRSGPNNPNYKESMTEGTYRQRTLDLKGKKCNRCSYDENEHAIVVHHIDRNRNNNTFDNLEVLCANCHAIEHWSD